MYLAGYMVTGFVVAGAYAIARLRGRWGRYERTALAMPLTIAALASPVQVLVGDWAAREVAKDQPTKLAAFEGLGRHRGAARRSTSSAGTPTARSSTASRSRSCCRCWPSTIPTRRVQGLDAVPAADRPPVNVVRFAFQTMVGIGTLLALLGRGRALSCACAGDALPESRWFYRGAGGRRAAVGGRADRRLGRRPRSAASRGSSTG